MTDGPGDRLPDENWWATPQAHDSMRLHEAIEHRDLAAVKTLSASLPRSVIQTDVLPDLTIESRLWFWRQVATVQQFRRLTESMLAAATKILSDGDFMLGRDYSVAAEDDMRILLVNDFANDFLAYVLPPERYATLQLILRFAQGVET